MSRHVTFRRITPAVLCILAAGLAGASLAWACMPGVRIHSLTPATGPAGTNVEVRGGFYTERQEEASVQTAPWERVEIRWNSVEGSVLRSVPVRGSTFSASVTIPSVEPGTYVIVAKAIQTDGNWAKNQQAFRVTVAGAGRGGQPAVGSQQKPSGIGANGNPRNRTLGGARGGDGSGAGGSLAGAPGSTAASPARAGGSEPAARTGAAPARDPDGPMPSGRSATGDLWTGFVPARRASLVPHAGDPEVPGASHRSPLLLGAGLLSVGLATLFAGFFAAARRHRVRASGRS